MDYQTARDRLVDRLEKRESLGERTAAAMRAVPRHEFVPESRRSDAYDDSPLPIGQGQTISAPHMVAIMIDLLDLEPGDEILEIGTGCGYHAAVTAEIVGPKNVYTVEYHEDLAQQARVTLSELGYDEISVRAGDGKEGWPEHAPYDAAYLTCAAESFPSAIIEQLRPGGIVLAPLERGRQVLIRGRVGEDGIIDREEHGYVRFVPLQ